jgi:hypothetical protein
LKRGELNNEPAKHSSLHDAAYLPIVVQQLDCLADVQLVLPRFVFVNLELRL